MKIPVDWLQDYLAKPLTAREMADGLEQAGVEVDQIISPELLDAKIIVGKVLEVAKHPEADRLHLVKVDTGKQVLDIVCGAPNVRKGLLVALAQVGAVLPDGAVIEPATIRGQKSAGMLCSARELGWGNDHDGIVELASGFKVGSTLCDIVPNPEVLDVSTSANRPDLQSLIGLAREISAQTGIKLKLPQVSEKTGKSHAPEVIIEAPEKVSRYMAQVFEVDATHPTLPSIQAQLRAAGVRPINIVVDATNYCMLEYGQPLHAFDADKVHLPITARLAKKGEKITTLDNVNRTLAGTDLIIADSRGPIAIAGVMGSASSQIETSTKRIVIESATFDAASVRKTALRLGLRTDASSRFERGLPVQLAPLALSRVSEILQKAIKANPASQVNDKLQVWPWIQRIGVRPSRVSSMLGIKLTEAEMIETLAKLDIDAKPFDIAIEAKSHLGKAYKFGAKFRTDGVDAFDCSYLTDYLYSLIGVWIGHTAHEQFKSGKPVELADLVPGDLVFRGGPFEKRDKAEREGVSHVGIYIGGGKIIHAADIERSKTGKWLPRSKKAVVEESLTAITEDPEYLGARRYAENIDDFLSITEAPWWRPDLKNEEDIIEEVARLIGYDKVPATIPVWRPEKITVDKWWPQQKRIKNVLKAQDLFEVMTYSFVSEQQLHDFGHTLNTHLRLKNPLSLEQAFLRSDLGPSLLTTISKNSSYAKEFGVFEISRVFKSRGNGRLPHEITQLGVMVTAPKLAYSQAKAALDALAKEFNVAVELHPKAVPALHPARGAEVLAAGQIVGRIGEIHPDILAKSKIDNSVAYLELDVEAWLAASTGKSYQAISRYPAVLRDLAVVVKKDVLWQEIERTVNDAGLAKVEFLNDYYGSDIPVGHKSVAMRLTMSSLEGTLTDSEADIRLDGIIQILKHRFDAKLR